MKLTKRDWQITVLVVAGWMALFTHAACKGKRGGGVTGPNPVPTTAPTQVPPTVPFPVRLSGDRFVPPLVGAVICCASGGPVDEGLRDGWELINRDAAERFAAAGVNVTHLRTGPYRGPDNYAALRPTVDMLAGLRMSVEITLIDGWVLRHNLDRWGDGCAVTWEAPKARHIEHVKRVVQETLAPHVFYDIGNEISLCRPADAWYDGIARAAREAGATLVGGDADLPSLQYYNYHGFGLESVGGKPSLLNESNNRDYSPGSWGALIANALETGGRVNIMYWRGPHTDEQQRETLEIIRKLTRGEHVDACLAPSTCPDLVAFGLGLYRTEGFDEDARALSRIELAEIAAAEAAGYAIWNSTPRFGSGRGRPCNDEHHEICSSACGAWRRCEDPTGPTWFGAVPLRSNPYLAKSEPEARVRVCAESGWRDHEGKLVNVPGGQVCSAELRAVDVNAQDHFPMPPNSPPPTLGRR
jgi:hypothetical protein